MTHLNFFQKKGTYTQANATNKGAKEKSTILWAAEYIQF